MIGIINQRGYTFTFRRIKIQKNNFRILPAHRPFCLRRIKPFPVHAKRAVLHPDAPDMRHVIAYTRTQADGDIGHGRECRLAGISGSLKHIAHICRITFIEKIGSRSGMIMNGRHQNISFRQSSTPSQLLPDLFGLIILDGADIQRDQQNALSAVPYSQHPTE